ncbi:MAG: TauD/TfdA family dioxygenase [Pseudomonadota bacterium]
MKCIEAPADGAPLADWAMAERAQIEDAFAEAGVVLLRGFDTSSPTVLKDLLSLFGEEPMEDARWSSPREPVGEGAFTSTEYPEDRTIVLHSEMSYARLWPRILMFQCKKAAASGGATTIADLNAVSDALGEIVEEFADREVLYVRNFRPGIDIRWQDAFGTDDPAAVEEIGAAHGLEVEFQDGGVLRTYQQAQGAVEGPLGSVWFNQAHLFHPFQLDPNARRQLLDAFGEEGIPRNALFGDGEPIPDETIRAILSALERCAQPIDWRDGDVALVDNMRWMHGRAPFSGERKVLVAMGRPQDEPEITPLFG